MSVPLDFNRGNNLGHFVVWDGAGRSTVSHPNFREADEEAKRLARANPGKTYAVLNIAALHRVADLRSAYSGMWYRQ